MPIRIPVQADFDTTNAEQQIQQFQQKLNAMGQQIAQANRSQYTPVNAKSIEDLKKLNAQFAALLKISGDLRKRMNATGQGGASFVDLDWSKLYPDAGSRARQMQKAFSYITGSSFSPAAGGQQPPRRPPGGAPHTAGQMGMGAVQAGLSAANGATGGVSGVAGNALNAGMSSGFGAGLMGLVGGMVALGVGKLVGAVTEKIGQAEDNNVAYDKLKRTLGDVNVSFDGLKAVLKAAADNTRTTYAETARLGQQFVKLGNITSDQYKTLGGELETGIGLSRGFGLDPEQGVGALGQVRGVGFSRNEQDTRRFALLIGETIGKSGAFAKADEVMEAMTQYTVSQTRQSLSAPNSAAFGGMYSAMVGSGIPGLDPTGTGAILSRINSVLSAGGGHGESSQFFTQRLGAKRGMDVFDTQLWREGGAFASADSTFDKGSAVGRYYQRHGLKAPGGGDTLLSANIKQLRQDYGRDPKALLMAMANQLGISMSQAAAIEEINPNKMGGMQKYGDLTKLNPFGIANLSKALYGNAGDRQGLAQSLLGRTGDQKISDADASAIRGAQGDDGKLKEVLAKLVGKYDQEMTTGKAILESKNALDNLKTSIADKLVPYTQDIRAGILWMAGDKKKSADEVLKEIASKESQLRGGFISGDADNQRDKARKESEARIVALDKKRQENDIFFQQHGPMTLFDPKTPKSLLDEYKRRGDEGQKIDDEIMKEKKLLLEQKKQIDNDEKQKLAKENSRLKKEIEDIEARSKARLTMEEATGPTGAPGAPGTIVGAPSGRPDRRFSSGGNSDTSSIDAKLAEAERRTGLPPGTLKAVISQETGGKTSAYLEDPSKYHYGLNAEGRRVAPHTGKVSTAFGPFGILESTGKKPGFGVSPLKDKSIDEQIRFASDYLAARTKSAGSLHGGLSGYGEGSGYASSVMPRVRRSAAPMPDDAAAEAQREANRVRAMTVTVEPLRVVHENTRGEQVRPSETLNTKVRAPTPFGAGR